MKIKEMINCQGRRNDEGEFPTCNAREKVKNTTEFKILINIYLKVVFFRFPSQKNVKSFIYILKYHKVVKRKKLRMISIKQLHYILNLSKLLLLHDAIDIADPISM